MKRLRSVILTTVCLVTLPLLAAAGEVLPAEVAGEWWNQQDGFQTLSLYLFTDGQGGLFTATSRSKATATYDRKFSLLRVVADGDTYLFAYNPAAKSLTSLGSSYTKWPLLKQRANLEQFIAQHFNQLWALRAKRLDVGQWVIHYRGEFARTTLDDGSYQLKITGDVLAIGEDAVHLGAEFHVAEDGSGSLSRYGAGVRLPISEITDPGQLEQVTKLRQPK